MRFETAPKKDVWRGRGRPRREVPPLVMKMADETYRSGNVGVLTVSADEETELKEMQGYLNSYAASLGKRIRYQRTGDRVAFAMVDIQRRKKAAA